MYKIGDLFIVESLYGIGISIPKNEITVKDDEFFIYLKS